MTKDSTNQNSTHSENEIERYKRLSAMMLDAVKELKQTIRHYETAPDNASNPEKISFRISGNEFVDGEGNVSIYATVTDNGEVTFTRPGQVVVTVSTEDGSRLSDTVNILCKKPRQ